MSIGERIVGGRYRVVGVLGDGGMARVYKARDERLGRLVAVKLLHDYYTNQPAFVGRFEQEARLAAGLNHPNIMAVYDTGHDDGGAHYIIMEYVEGETLKRLVEREAPLALPAAVAILRQICLALDAAHARGVVHRDVKPENIFLTPDRTVKVGDFGIARALDANTLTPAGMVLGSVSYFAPEQALGQRSTAQSDLYATGVVLYELLTGRLPFVAENALGVAMMHLNADPAPPSRYHPALPPAVDAVVLVALAKDPARRYRSGAAFVDALVRAAHAPSTVATITPPTPAPSTLAATTPLPVAVVTPVPATRLLAMRPRGTRPAGTSRVGATPATSSADPPGASTTHRLADGSWTALPSVRGGAPRGAAPSMAVAPARGSPPPRRWRALTLLVVPLVAVLTIAGAIKVITGGQGQGTRYGAGDAGTPTATAMSVRATATARRGQVLVVPTVAPSAPPTPRHTVFARRPDARRGHLGQARRTPAPGSRGGAGGAGGAGTYSYATSPATTHPADVPATVAPAVPPVVVQPTSTDVPAATPPRAVPTWTPRPPATATSASPPATATSVVPPSTNTPVPLATATPLPADTPTSTAAPQDVIAPTDTAGAAAPTTVPTDVPSTVPTDVPSTVPTDVPSMDTPSATATAIPAMAVPPTAGDAGVPASLHLNNVAVSAQALAAVYHANDVYMQVMNGPDASAVDTAYGPYLANVNRGVAATLVANHQHWRISLVGTIGLSNAHVIDANTVRVTVTKTENAELLSDAGHVIKPSYRDTETFVDTVQRLNGNWLVTQVYH